MVEITVKAPTNIAVVKYWGKHEVWEKYHIPTKSSASFTVDGLYTTTALTISEGSGNVEFILNGKTISPTEREFKYVGQYINKLFAMFPEVKNYDYKIETKNNFPTAAGYASSASGFAAMAKALQEAMKIKEPKIYEKYMRDDILLSAFARMGSGSATRSIPSRGGFVVWWRGIDSSFILSPESVSKETREKIIFSSYAESLFPPEYWPDLRIIYASVKKSEKKVKSRAGMKQTVKTNPLYYNWVEYEEKVVLNEMINAVKNRDFNKFAELTMSSSNGLHSVMLYTNPRIVYLNDTSHKIIDTIHEMNEGKTKAAYTFDAGPNAVIFTLERYINDVKSAIGEIVGEDNIIVTKPGRGPRVVEVKE